MTDTKKDFNCVEDLMSDGASQESSGDALGIGKSTQAKQYEDGEGNKENKQPKWMQRHRDLHV